MEGHSQMMAFDVKIEQVGGMVVLMGVFCWLNKLIYGSPPGWILYDLYLVGNAQDKLPYNYLCYYVIFA